MSLQDIIYTLDANGECCAGTVDACGVCGGPSLFIDAAGICCPHAPLPSSGLCCASRVDSCGVCGGLDACGGSVSVELGGLHPDFEVVWSSFAFLGIGNDKVSNPHARPGGLESVSDVLT